MPFDNITMSAAVRDAQALTGGRITKIHQPDKYSVMLRIYATAGNFKLLLSAHPADGRIQMTERTAENPAKPPLFCMVLRKHLDGARLLNIRQIPGERIVRLDFAAHDEIGTPTERTLILEIMGKHSNLILIDTPTERIIDAARRYSHNVSRHREVLPNLPYLPPPQSDKPDWQQQNEDEFAALLLNGDLEQPPERLLQSTFAGLAPFLCREICCRAGLGERQNSEELGMYEISRLYEQLQILRKTLENADFQPILLGKNGRYNDFYALSLVSKPEAAQKHFPTMSEALDEFYQSRDDAQEFESEQRRLSKLLSKEQQRLAKKIKLEERDYAEAAGAEKYKNAGDLLMAYLHLVQPGQTEIELPSFYEQDKLVKITLLPELSAADNAKRFFRRYNKAKKSERQIQQQLEANRSELEYVESLLAALDEAANLTDLQALHGELVESGYLKLPKAQKKVKLPAATQQPQQFVTSEGFLVLLGRNNKQNDRLTLKIADKDDIWFHAQKIPGSHVILKREQGRDFSELAIAEAAALAARHSKAGTADKVPVDYTEVHNVKKPNGAKPGMVIYFEQQTIYVTPKDLQPAQNDNDK